MPARCCFDRSGFYSKSMSNQPVGIVGGQNFDLKAGKLEMKKLVGESRLHGKGIGKRAMFGFLDDIGIGDKHQDIVRMALFKPRWLQIFSRLTRDRSSVMLALAPDLLRCSTAAISTNY